MTLIETRIFAGRAIIKIRGQGELSIEDGGYHEWTEKIYSVPRIKGLDCDMFMAIQTPRTDDAKPNFPVV